LLIALTLRSFALSKHRFEIGLTAVIFLVALRLSLGCHFLYEGIWKIKNRSRFSAEPFLAEAKGPLAGLFHAMLPENEWRRLLRPITDEKGRKSFDLDKLTERWDRLCKEFVDFYRPRNLADAEVSAAYERLQRGAERTYERFCNRLAEYLDEHVAEISAYFDALERWENDAERRQSAYFQNKRRWERMMELRSQLAQWVSEIQAQEKALENALYDLLDEKQRAQGYPPKPRNPFRWERMEQINFAVTYGLTAIGLCLMLGLFTLPAAIGGAIFMAMVVMTQPAWPTIYPPDSPIVGHALLINKDFIELVALLVIAALPAGRWGGLDFFLFRRHRSTHCPREKTAPETQTSVAPATPKPPSTSSPDEITPKEK